MVEFRIDIVGNARQVDRTLNQLEQRLGRVEQEATDVNTALAEALSQRDRGAIATLNSVERTLAGASTQAGRLQQGLTAALSQGRNVAGRSVEQVSSSLSRADAEAIKFRQDIQQLFTQRDRTTGQSVDRIGQSLAAARQQARATKADLRILAEDVRLSGLRRAKELLEQTETRASSLRRVVQGAFAGIGAGIAIREFVQASDQLTNVRNRLRLVTESEQELIATQNALLEISERTRSSFDGTAQIFSRLAISADDLGTTNQELLAFTESLNQAIILSGASAQEASAGLIQLSQGLASGALRGDELRSVLEQLPAVADVIAQEIGVTRGELRELGAQGKITSDIILRAFANARGELADRFATTVPTVGQAFQVLGTQVIGLVGEFNDATGASELLAQGILLLGENLDAVSTIVLTFSTALGVRLAVNAIPAAIKALSGLSLATAAAGGAFTIAVGAVFVLSQRLQQYREDLKAIEQAQRDIAATNPFAQQGRQIDEAKRRINEINRAIQEGGEVSDEVRASQLKQIENLKDRISELRTEIRGEASDQRAKIREAKDLEESRLAEVEAIKRQKKLLEEIEAPGRTFAALQTDLNVLLESNRISQEQFNIALQAGREAFKGSTETISNPFAEQIDSIREQNQLLEDRNTQGRFAARALEIERQLRKEGVELTREQQGQLAQALLAQEKLTEAARARQVFDSEAQRIAAETQELEILATEQAGARREALLIEARLRAQGVELTDEQVQGVQRLIEAQEEYNLAIEDEKRLDAIRGELGELDRLEVKLQDLLFLRQQEPELAEAAGKAYEALRLQQLDAATDLESGFQRAFIRIKQEAEDLASVAEAITSSLVNNTEDAVNGLLSNLTNRGDIKLLRDQVNSLGASIADQEAKIAASGKAATEEQAQALERQRAQLQGLQGDLDKAEFTFEKFASSVVQDLQRIAIRLLVVKALNAVLGGGGDGGGSVIDATLNKGRASGGTVQPGQAPFPVGEEGPEIFVPRQTGTIIPNPASVQQPPPVVNLSVNNVTNPNEVNDEINSGNADEAFVNMITRRRNEIIQVLGVTN